MRDKCTRRTPGSLAFRDRAPMLGCSAIKASDFSNSSPPGQTAQDYGSIDGLTPLSLPDSGK